MNTFKQINPGELARNPFKMIGSDWMLVTAEKNGTVNTMTASWGGVGILWNKPVAFVFIRPQRYTKEFVDNSDFLSLSVLNDTFRSQLNYLGTVSGRNEPKIEKSGLSVRREHGIPFFDEAEVVFLCRKLYAQTLDSACFIDTDIDAAVYAGKDYHTVYVCEIKEILVR